MHSQLPFPVVFKNMAFVICVQNILTNMAPKNAWQSCLSSRHYSPGPRPLALVPEPGPRTVGRAPGPHSRARAPAPGSGRRASAPVPVPNINMLYCNCVNVLYSIHIIIFNTHIYILHYSKIDYTVGSRNLINNFSNLLFGSFSALRVGPG